MYKIIISELRDLRKVLMDDRWSNEVKLHKYNRTSGFIYGFCLALARTEGTRYITGNMIDLMYAYLYALREEYIK